MYNCCTLFVQMFTYKRAAALMQELNNILYAFKNNSCIRSSALILSEHLKNYKSCKNCVLLTHGVFFQAFLNAWKNKLYFQNLQLT